MGVRLAWISLAILTCLHVGFATSKFPPCPGHCQCGQGSRGDFDVTCPKYIDSTLHAQIKDKEYLKIQCTGRTQLSDFKMLEGLDVGPVSVVMMTFCPLPASLSLLMNSMNVSGVKTLTVQYSNLTHTLTKSQFDGFPNLTTLGLIDDGLSFIPDNFFTEMRNLTHLNLRENKLELPLKLLDSLPNLRYLELGRNGIKNLTPGVFRNLTQLKLLNLWGNSLQNLTRHVFEDIKGLESLDLHQNDLVTLDADVFTHLTNLKNLSLMKNNFSSLPPGLFADTLLLENLSLGSNRQRLVMPSGLLANLTKLKDVTLNWNNISQLPNDLLWGSTLLTNIRLQKNSLTTLPEALFKDATNLQLLDLSWNKLQMLPKDLFSPLAKLRVLKLSNNQLTNITEATFRGLAALQELDLERNGLRHIDAQAFANNKEVKKMMLSHNFLTFHIDGPYNFMPEDIFGAQSPLHYCVKLEELQLANNSLGEIFADWRITMSSLSKLDLSRNNITYIQSTDLQYLTKKIVVDLSNNKISVVDLKNLEYVVRYEGTNPSDVVSRQAKIILKNNPLRCDCQVYNLLKYIEGKLEPNVYQFVEFNTNDFTCASPSEVSGIALSKLKSTHITCALRNEDLRGERCPEPCTCWGRPDDRALIVDCANVGLRLAPQSLPLTTTWNHTEIHLEKNWLRTLPNVSLPGYSRVTKIYASHNNITFLQQANIPSKLEILDLAYNNMSRVDNATLYALSNVSSLHRISIYKNPWQCDCEARDLLNFIQAKFKKVDQLDNVSCTDGRMLSHLSADDLCLNYSNIIVISCISIAIVSIIVGALIAMYFRYQREVKVWLYAHNTCLWFVTEEELDKDKQFDAFISYSHKDEEFVAEHLVSGLESGPNPFKLCLHYRDWIAGDWIPNQIARSVADSRRTVVILSPSFLESVWGRMEFRAAHSQALNEGRARVIVILYEDVGPIEGLDPELKAYLSMNTYVKWGDPWFWDKLRYALPHPPQQLKRSSIINKQPELRINTNFEDKLELMEPTTPSATTPPASTIINPMHQSNGHIIATTIPNGHAKLVKETNEQVNGYVKSI